MASTRQTFFNTFVGRSSGDNNTTGSNNTAIGANAKVGSIFVPNLNNATAIAADVEVSQSNSIVLGTIIDVNGATASTNVGIGTTAPKTKLHVVGGSIYVANPNTLIITSLNESS